MNLIKKKPLTVIIILLTTQLLAYGVLADSSLPQEAPQPPHPGDTSQAEATFTAPDINEGAEPNPEGGINGLDYDFSERSVSFSNMSYDATAPAYMKITSTLPWSVSVSITPFAQTPGLTEKTIEGFTMNLNPTAITNLYPDTQSSATVSQQVLRALDSEGNPTQIGIQGAKTPPIAEGGMGVWTLQIPATLNVLGNTAHIGSATAQINWIFIQVKP
jgi:hypothetical protein